MLVLPGLLTACAGFGPTNPPALAFPTVGHLVLPAGNAAKCSPAGTSLTSTIGLAVDAAGNIFVGDFDAQRVDKITPDGKLVVIAGTGKYRGTAFAARNEGSPATAWDIIPQGLAIDGAGNVYIADYGSWVYRVSADGRIHLVAGKGQFHHFSGDGGPAKRADLYSPAGLLVDPSGNLYISDRLNYRVRRVSPDGVISTVAGNGTKGNMGDGGLATAAQLDEPSGLAMDDAGNLYIATWNAVRKVDREGLITTVAGNFTPNNAGFGGQATDAALLGVTDVALDHHDNLYIVAHVPSNTASDDGGLFVVTPDGILHKILSATNGSQVNAINAVATDPHGNVYYAATCGVYRLENN